MRKTWLIARKDIKESFGRRTLLLRIMVPVLIMPILYGGLLGYAIRRAGARPEHAAMLTGQISLYASLIALMGTVLGGAIAADAIAGEKERRTIESLMATPTTDLEIFAGKLLAGFLPSIVGGYGAALLFFATARMTAGAQPLLIPGVVSAARLIIVAIPIATAIFIAIGIIVSARCASVTTATQISALLGLPVFGGMLYFALRASRWPLSHLLLAMAGCIAVAVLLLFVGARAMGRDEIIARLD
jgi:ABC-type Na+ efflux pump permease subunit